MALPKVRSAARDEFAEQLREEGLVDIEERDEERLEVASGTRAKLTQYDAVLPVETSDGDREVPMEGWLASWHDDAMLLAGGLHPTEPLSDSLDIAELEHNPDASREELQSLIQQIHA